MKFFLSLPVLCIVILVGCHNHTNPTAETKTSPAIDSEASPGIFPVTEFLLGQLREIDSMPVTPVEISVADNRRDSVWRKREDIRKFAAPFLTPVFDAASMHDFFDEKSFMDLTVNAVTLTYDPKAPLPDSIKLTHCDVYIDPKSHQVQRIYLVKEDIQNGETVTTQLTWKVNQWCSIRTIEHENKTVPTVKEKIMKWDMTDP
jgi:hypothetical protein